MRTFCKADVECLGAADRRPVASGDNRGAGWQPHHVEHAGDRAGRAVVDPVRRAAGHRAELRPGMDEPGDGQVGAEDRLAPHLRRDVEAWHGLAGKRMVRPEDRFGRHRPGGGASGIAADAAQRPIAGADLAVHDVEGAGSETMARCGLGD